MGRRWSSDRKYILNLDYILNTKITCMNYCARSAHTSCHLIIQAVSVDQCGVWCDVSHMIVSLLRTLAGSYMGVGLTRI
jgi:transcription elongation factor Elf1